MGCSLYANASLLVVNQANYRFFPPFKRYVNANGNDHLGGEYFNMALALVAGEGFAHPFDRPSGPTAWQPPVLPLFLAGLLWLGDGQRDAVMIVVVFLQVCVLIGTGWLVLALVQRTSRLPPALAAGVFLIAVLGDFRLWFQSTHDSWLVLLMVDLLVAGLCWFEPLGTDAARRSMIRAAGWGCFGGIAAQVNPIVGFTWCVATTVRGSQRRAWSRLAIAMLAAVLTLAPWTLRNYLLFGRFIPLKSNLAYELYQSQCLQPDGLLQGPTFVLHPYGTKTLEGREYLARGEIDYLDRKREQFLQTVRADPADFARRIGDRFIGAALWYEPFERGQQGKRPFLLWLGRLTHPLPFLGLLVLCLTSFQERLRAAQGIVMGVYLLYLLPYVAVSYYERYALPLLGVKVLLVIWAADRMQQHLLPRGRARRLASPEP